MDADKIAHWQAADALFDQWLDLADGEQDAWLATQDPIEPVRRRLQMLIDAHRRPRAGLAPAGNDLSGVTLGDWTLEDELGRGGMAVVYRAWREQGMARQQAAVKILTLGALGAAGRERFQREAEILARLNHPNVTALVDSGVSEDGTCWLAMPLVEGRRIDAWCDSNALDAHAIVRLYLQVCGAIAYAHRNLVIHRDIKPSNVLVDDDGHVRLLDFGIGQFADGTGEATLTMWRALTPGYAAPEQLRGDPPSTAVDVYGLGALLHRLLTGRTPHLPTETADTTRPSLLVRDAGDAYHRHYVPLKTDLDRVLLKALAEEPEHRYPTAEALADDLRRWLDGRPVLAEKPKPGYRLRKFVARNRMGVAAGLLLAASVAGGIGATLWQAGEARREAENARAQARRAEQVRDFLERVFTSTQPTTEGVPTALDLLEEGSRRARDEVMATDPGAAADILLLTGYARAHLSRYDEATRDLHDAQRLLREHRPEALYELWRSHLHLASIHRTRGQLDAAIDEVRAADLVNKGREDVSLDDDVFTQLSLAGTLYSRDPQSAEQLFRQVLQQIQGTELEGSSRHLSAVTGIVASLHQQDKHDSELLSLIEEKLRMSREVDGANSGAYAHSIAGASTMITNIPGQQSRALELAQEAAELVAQIYPEPHYYKTGPFCNLAFQLVYRDRSREALVHFDAGIANANAISAEDIAVSGCLAGRGFARAKLGDYDAAVSDLASSRAMSIRVGQASSSLNACGMQVSVLVRQDRLHAAQDLLEECRPEDEATAPKRWRQARSEVLFAIGDLDGASGIAASLREEAPPGGLKHGWMGHWMLSLLLADTLDDDAMRSGLVAELGDFAALSPLSDCLAAPNATNCLALP